MKRRRFSEREVIETLHCCGIDVLCYRCRQKIEPGRPVEREHILELALGGADAPSNCAYSHKACHATATNGTKATTAGSSKHRIAKAKRLAKGGRARKGRKIPPRPFQKGKRPMRWHPVTPNKNAAGS